MHVEVREAPQRSLGPQLIVHVPCVHLDRTPPFVLPVPRLKQFSASFNFTIDLFKGGEIVKATEKYGRLA